MKLDHLKSLWKKYRLVCAVLLIGLFLILLPHGSHTNENTAHTESMKSDIPTAEESEKRLVQLLKKVRGVGEVHVLLSFAASEERVYVKDEGETVLLNVGSGKQIGLERKVVLPAYQGAVVVCEGAEDASVQMRVIEAVRQFTGLRTDQISVLPLV